jgi:hypothetical protein
MGHSAWKTLGLVASSGAALYLVACGGDDSPSKGGLSAGGSSGSAGSAGTTIVNLGGGGNGGKGGSLGTSGSDAGGDDSGGAPPVVIRPTPGELPSGWAARSEFLGGNVGNPTVAIDAAGKAHVVMDGYTLYVVPFDANGWGTAAEWETESYSTEAKLALNDAGQGVMLWNSDADTTAIKSAVYDPETGWTQGDALLGDFTQAVEFDIAVTSTGSALAVWLDSVPDGGFVQSSFFDGATWSTIVDVGRADFGSLVRPAVGVDDLGHGATFWRASDDGVFITHCQGAIFDGVSWATSTRVSGELEGCYLPDMAMRGNGDGIGVYEYEYDLYAMGYTAAGGWQAGVNISNAVDRGTYAGGPEIAFDGAGNALVAWREEVAADSSKYGLFYNRQTAGTWGSAQTLAMPEGYDMQPGAELAFNSSGNGFLAWAGDDLNGFRTLFGARYTAGEGFAAPFEIDAGMDGGSGVALEVDINEAGDIVVVWDRRDDDGAHAFATYYDAP